jgi:hypothetical protein
MEKRTRKNGEEKGKKKEENENGILNADGAKKDTLVRGGEGGILTCHGRDNTFGGGEE